MLTGDMPIGVTWGVPGGKLVPGTHKRCKLGHTVIGKFCISAEEIRDSDSIKDRHAQFRLTHKGLKMLRRTPKHEVLGSNSAFCSLYP